MSYDLRYEFGGECKTPAKPFLTATLPHLLQYGLLDAYYDGRENVARIFRMQGDKIDQAMFISFVEMPDQMPSVTAYLALHDYAVPSSDMYDALCAVCSSRYVTEDVRPLVQILHKFKTTRFTDVAAAIARSRLHQYESGKSELSNETNLKLTAYVQVIDYWKFAK